uniref:UBC core domain-containing protein n=1 Tax=Salix viminalis TaxID=40686 RepID=A0A6N2N731_SALVM
MALALPSLEPRQQQQQTTARGEIQEIDIFHRFDVVSDSSDHHYLDIIKKENNSGSKKTKGEGDSFSNISSGAYKKIMQEWKILEKHLPDSIYVRVYENRIDLLRAVIIGAAGTPYHDGLYFFDIAFPPDFPARPPLVYYRSFGLRINPNLYANGRALVLNEKPYYNEPGNGVLPGRAIWEKKSNAYSENVFFLSCKTMLFLLRTPPTNFEGFVTGHFREKAGVILSACNAYIKGEVRVGFYRNDGSCSSCTSSSHVHVSEKFKGLMGQLYPQLVSGFKRNGASLGDFLEQLKQPVEKKTLSFKGKTVRMVFGKLKKVLGLKKKDNSGKSGVKSNGS